VSPFRHQRKRYEQNHLQGELRKIKPPTFDGENKMGEDAKAWLLGIRKYFLLHNYPSNLEAKITIQGKYSNWWDQLKQVKHIDERRISSKHFKKYFQQKYLSEHYDDKMQEMFELKVGNMTLEEYVNKFLELLRYVGYIKDEKVKIERFLNGLLAFYKDKIQSDEPKTLEETIEKGKYLTKAKAKQIFKNLGEKRKRTSKIRRRRDLNLLSSRTVLIHISKTNNIRVDLQWQNPWGKGKATNKMLGM
jgi:hypothetical protein